MGRGAAAARASPPWCACATRRRTCRGSCRRCSTRSRTSLLLDNGSADGSADVARRVAREAGAEERLDVRDYPFAVARCGDEHLGTPPDSVHSLTYFYNWSFAHVRTAYALKWDGDMVLTDAATAALRDLAWQLEAAELIVKVPRYPLYVVDERRAFVDTPLRNCEPWGWPNGPGYSFAKAIDWELPLWAADTPTLTLPDWGCVEVKRLDADEFGHWSHTDFDASARTPPQAARVGGLPARSPPAATPPEGVVAVEAPAGVHVIEHVRASWLPRRAAGRANRSGRPRPRSRAAARAAPRARPAATRRPARRRGSAARRGRPQVVELDLAAAVLDVEVLGRAQPGEAGRGAGRPRRRALEQDRAAAARGRVARERQQRHAVGLPARRVRRSASRIVGARSPFQTSCERVAPRGMPGPRISSGTRIDGS